MRNYKPLLPLRHSKINQIGTFVSNGKLQTTDRFFWGEEQATLVCPWQFQELLRPAAVVPQNGKIGGSWLGRKAKKWRLWNSFNYVTFWLIRKTWKSGKVQTIWLDGFPAKTGDVQRPCLIAKDVTVDDSSTKWGRCFKPNNTQKISDSVVFWKNWNCQKTW